MSSYTNANNTAYTLAEAGMNNAISILNASFQPATPTLLQNLPVYTFDTGTATVSGTLSGTTWTITSVGSVRNPTGPTATPVTRRLVRSVSVQGLSSGGTVSAWSRIYNDDTSVCATIPDHVVIPSNYTTRGNLCLTGSEITGSSTSVSVGGTVTLTPVSGQSDVFAAGTATGWTNSTNVTANDGVYATNNIGGQSNGSTLKATGFGFNLIPGATVVGISVLVEQLAGASSALKDLNVQLLKAGTAVGSNKASTSYWPNKSTNSTYGASTDLWGTTWTAADVNNASFGLQLSAQNFSSSNVTASIDYITITVYYTDDASIGLSGTPVTEADIAGTCKWSTQATHSPCSPTDHVWANTVATSTAPLAKPGVDFSYWYQNAAPGPKHGCDVSNGTPPAFDSNGTYDGSNSSQELTPEPGPKDDPAGSNGGTIGNTAYTCIAKDAQGNTIGQLSWNNQTRVLTVQGTIFFDGNAVFHDHNGYVVHYQGKATMYIAGSWHNDEAVWRRPRPSRA